MSRKRKTRREYGTASGPEAAVPVPAAPAPSGTAAPDRKRAQSRGLRPIDGAAFATLVALTLGLYASTLDLGFFNLDDSEYVVNNPLIRAVSSDNLRRILTEPWFANYSPLHILSYLLDHAAFGLDPHGFHLSSNLWAALISGLVYLVALGLAGDRRVALASGVLFAVHPAHVEAVAWISSRKDLVSTAFALPAILAWLHYRKGGGGRRRWYLLSLALFTLAVAGKLSVAVVPGILFLFDVLVARRRFWASLAPQIPMLAVALVVAAEAGAAQPSTRRPLSLFGVGRALGESLSLLAGFGDYVIYRLPPDPATAAAASRLLFALLPAAAVGLTFVLARRVVPEVALLVAWVLLALAPSQVLSLAHPVADRYLFFPSVAVVFLIAWAAFAAAERIGRLGRHARLAVPIALLVLLAVGWARETRAYLAEWHDPRSVWFAASTRSEDFHTNLYLGSHYQDHADEIASGSRAGKPISPRAQALAAVLSPSPGAPPAGEELVTELRTLAWEQFERAHSRRTKEVVPNLYYRRGKLLLDSKRPAEARPEFERALEQGESHTYEPVRRELSVRSRYALGVVAWTAGDYRQAKTWIDAAAEEQRRAGGHWVPDIDEQRARLARIVAGQP
jgi:hypothetical protein